MSSSTIAHQPANFSRLGAAQPRKYGKARSRGPTAQRPWSSVALKVEGAASSYSFRIGRPPAYVWVLATAALLAHGYIAWYLTHHAAAAVPPKKHEVQLEIVPPKPPEPKKLEPPKPEPPKPQLRRPAQVLPPIQQSAPLPNDTPAVATSEPPIAVAPIVSAPVEEKPEPVSAPIGRAGYLNNPPPEYPPMAARQGWEGTVTLRVHVLETGKVDAAEIQKSSGRRILDEQAVRTVKTWLFTPSKRGDTPIDGWAIVPIEFQLEH